MSGRITIVRYMQDNLIDHIDPLTGEVNDTGLAEDACAHFDDYEGDDIPEKYFDCALEVSLRYEIKTGSKTPPISGLQGLIGSLPSDWF